MGRFPNKAHSGPSCIKANQFTHLNNLVFLFLYRLLVGNLANFLRGHFPFEGFAFNSNYSLENIEMKISQRSPVHTEISCVSVDGGRFVSERRHL